MAHIWFDNVVETTTTTGTGDLTLAGAETAAKAFSAVCSTGDTFYYSVFAVDGNDIPTGDWEVGLGTYSGANTLTRTTVISSSNSDSAVNFSAGTKRVSMIQSSAGIKKHRWTLQFGPLQNEPPASNYATLDTRNNRPVLDFDDTTEEESVWTLALPEAYEGGGITVDIWCALTSATSGTVGWKVAIERIDASSLDIDSDSFASANTVTAVTVPGTSGQVLKMSVDISDGANMDSVAAGELFRIKVSRDVASDTATGDAELLRVQISEQ